ncbi:MAG: hypothetical protein ACYC2I_09250 [Elusimicrobiales bacterium]
MNLRLSDFAGMRAKDVVGLWYGYKKIISVGLSGAAAARLGKVFLKYGLRFAVLGENFDYRRRSGTYIVGRDEKSVRRAVAAYGAQRYDLIGALLGYPKCCVKRHCGIITGKGPMNDFVRRSAAASGRFLWQLNNVLDFDGRLNGAGAAGLDLARLPHASLISHNPCSYDCAPSLKIAGLNRALLLRETGEEDAEGGPAALALPVLYVDDFNFSVLKGASSAGRAAYRGVACTLGLKDIGRKIEAGDEAGVSGRTLTVWLKGRAILKKVLPVRPLILPFDAAPGRSRP